MEEFEAIMVSDRPDAEKLTRGFDWLSGRFLEQTQHDVALAQALNDADALVKAQIRLSVMQHARAMLAFCRQRLAAPGEARP